MQRYQPYILFLILLLASISSGCLGDTDGDDYPGEIDGNGAGDYSSLYPNDVDRNDGVAACADISATSYEQPCPSGLNMRRILDANGYVDWIAFTSGSLDGSGAATYDLELDPKTFKFSRWTLAVGSKDLDDPHVYLDWVAKDGLITPIGGSVMELNSKAPSGSGAVATETKNASWLTVEDDQGRIVRTLQMLISITVGVTLRVKVIDGVGGSGDFDLSLTIYTNRAPVGEATLLSPSTVGRNATMYLDGCKTRDPDFLDRQNDDPFGKLMWMLDSTDKSNTSARLISGYPHPCSISVDLSTRQLSLGTHQIHLLVKDAATGWDDEPDDIVTIPFEVVADGESVKPSRDGKAYIDASMNEVMEIDVLSPMQFIDLPFTRRDISIGVGLRFEIGIERTGDIQFDYIVDPSNGTFDLVNASAQLNAEADFRPWILFRYSIWDRDKAGRGGWKDGEVKIPMLSCTEVYDGMPSLPIEILPNGCEELYYWDRARSIAGISSDEFGAFSIDERMDIAGLDLYFVLKALSSTNFALDQLLNLLETIGSISIPLTFGMQIDANGVLSVEVDIFAGGTKIDGTSSIHAQLLGGESVRASRHTMSDDSGYVAIRAQGITEVDVTMTPTVEIGVDYSIFGVSVLDWSYNWQSPTGTGIGSHATYHSQEKTLNQLWDI